MRAPLRHARHRGRRPRILLALGGASVVATVAVAAFVGATSLRVVGTLSENAVTRPGVAVGTAEPEVPRWDGPVDLLIMGSDTRVGQLSGEYGAEVTSGARSDVMMLLHVSADHQDATLVSIPRDTMLPIPACTAPDGTLRPAQAAAQINGALDSGPFCSLDAVRAFTGLDVDHFLVVDFDGVIGVTEAIGGVDVCVEDDIVDVYSGLSLTAGEHSIQGAEALAFLRTRHGFADGSDLGRIQAQQTFLASLARKVTSAGTLTNPVALFGLADAAARSISVDEALASPTALAGLGGTLADVDLARMLLVQLPVEPYWADTNRVQPLAEQSDALFAALRADQPLALTDAAADAAAAATTEDAPAVNAQTTEPAAADLSGQTAAESLCAR